MYREGVRVNKTKIKRTCKEKKRENTCGVRVLREGKRAESEMHRSRGGVEGIKDYAKLEVQKSTHGEWQYEKYKTIQSGRESTKSTESNRMVSRI